MHKHIYNVYIAGVLIVCFIYKYLCAQQFLYIISLTAWLCNYLLRVIISIYIVGLVADAVIMKS